jgi:hypothetical protein
VPFLLSRGRRAIGLQFFDCRGRRTGNGQRDSARDQHRTNESRYAFTVTGLHADVYFPDFSNCAVSHSAQYSPAKKTNLYNGWHKGDGERACSAAKRSEMHREDLMNPDLLSEIVLLGSATLIFMTLVAVVVTALSRVAAL